jgi:hypothetical protein
MLFDRSIPILMEDDLLHTDHDPFCSDPHCPCHNDPDRIAQVNQHYQDGLLTPDEATNYVLGKTLA